ncbi:hypothetical protein DLAC_06275 [Tieghemostelium lacteum]|uniref:Redoxin domain-containing protein n=1 Tax=Tieghemostelium lacteum TaxID=361077 RepID=A0A151ZEC1_TIELA|nr:hypothetical protein DLAC_06275 [Tieghemostelium lacteum]|eukprot:KYQ92312.1 hypothetical protein DLAC_06275 [Tieghemostelium lacteum]
MTSKLYQCGSTNIINTFKTIQYNSTRYYTVGFNVLESKNLQFRDQFGKSHNAQSIFSGKKVVLFGIPNTTPVDDFIHIPSYVKNAEKIYKKGVDLIVCLTNSDVPVLRAKSISLDPKRLIAMLSDTESKFAMENQLASEKSEKGLGTEEPLVLTKRYAMIIDNGKITYENIERDENDTDHTNGESILKHL